MYFLRRVTKEWWLLPAQGPWAITLPVGHTGRASSSLTELEYYYYGSTFFFVFFVFLIEGMTPGVFFDHALMPL